jgi:monovalent cation:H+ antiporter-2, CPA2 family
MRRVQKQRQARYQLMREVFRGDTVLSEDAEAQYGDRLRPIVLQEDSPAAGRTLADMRLDSVVVTALARDGKRTLSPSSAMSLAAGDVVVLFGSPEDLQRAETTLLG